jgi:lipoprotein-anchoring transpeptidase ErfK/SrfK
VPAVLASLLVVAAFLVVRFASSSAAVTTAPDVVLPAPARPAFAIPEPQELGRSRAAARWATVIRAAEVRSAAHPGATAIAALETGTPERTTNVVLVRGSAADEAGNLWIAVQVPGLPRNVTGWVQRSALGTYGFVRTRLVVDLARQTATLFRGNRPVFRADVGVGTAASPTPTGQFYVRSKLWSLRSPFYGPLAFGTSARSTVLTDWPDGGFVGIHGTSQPELLPGRVSHGCIRMRNEDILELGRLMPVGTPVTIR